MSASETARKGRESSPDRSGDRYYVDARAQFAGIQRTLEGIGEGRTLLGGLRREARTRIDAAIYAAAGSVVAKQAQLDAGDGRPLTVCSGQTKRRSLPELQRWPLDRLGLNTIVGGIFGDGCGRVFVDSTTESRPVFAAYCPVCREKSESRRQLEVVERVKRLFQERFPIAGGWRVRCTGCGVMFSTTSSRRTRCVDCKH